MGLSSAIRTLGEGVKTHTGHSDSHNASHYFAGASTARSVVIMVKMPSASRTGTERVTIQTSATTRIKIWLGPDASIGGQWRFNPVLRIDVIGWHGKVQGDVTVIGTIDVGAGDHIPVAIQQSHSAAVESGVCFQVGLQALNIRDRIVGTVRHQLFRKGIEGRNHLRLQILLA